MRVDRLLQPADPPRLFPAPWRRQARSSRHAPIAVPLLLSPLLSAPRRITIDGFTLACILIANAIARNYVEYIQESTYNHQRTGASNPFKEERLNGECDTVRQDLPSVAIPSSYQNTSVPWPARFDSMCGKENSL